MLEQPSKSVIFKYSFLEFVTPYNARGKMEPKMEAGGGGIFWGEKG